MYSFSPTVSDVGSSPIEAAQAWINGRSFAPELPLMDVAQAVPGYPPAESLRRHLAAQVEAEPTAFYTSIFGLPALRRELARHMSEDYQATVDSSQVAIVAGCNQGFCAAVTALATPGNEIILPLPYYFNHQMWVDLQGARVVPLPFAAEAGGVPSADAAERLITSQTRAIALVSPNNPTGAVYPPQVLHDFFRLAREHSIALILDETYKDFRLERQPAHGLFAEPDWPEVLIQLYSFSKAFSLTGYRVGSVIADPRLLGEIGKFQDCVAICAPHIGQQAALFGLQHLDDWRNGKRHLMAERAQALGSAFAHSDLRYKIVSQGAYFAYVKHPFAGESAATVAKRLIDEHNVLCLPGTIFGPGQDAYLRIAFANLASDAMPQLVQRLVKSQSR